MKSPNSKFIHCYPHSQDIVTAVARTEVWGPAVPLADAVVTAVFHQYYTALGSNTLVVGQAGSALLLLQ